MLRQESGSLLLFLLASEKFSVCRNNWLRASAVIIALPAVWRVVAERSAKSDPPAPQGMRKVVLATNIAETSLPLKVFVWWWIVPRSVWRVLIAHGAYATDYSTR